MPKINPNERNGTPSKRVQRIALAIATSLVGVSIATVSSVVYVYDAFFSRYERPNYDLYPGQYCYSRIQNELARETLRLPSGENMLESYYYPAQNARGLVVLSHGIHAGADDYLPLIKAIVDRGYSVFTFDVTGVYSSGGDSMIGMCQSLRDLDRVLTFLNDDARFAAMPKFVIGHSWGGYAASSVLALHPEIKGAVLIAPMNNGVSVMVEKAAEHVGKAAYTAKPVFDAYQKMLFGDYVKYNGVIGVNSTSCPVLIAQGVDDTDISPNGQSITAHLDEITNPNVTVYWGKGLQGTHTGIWHSTESEAYQKAIQDRLEAREQELGRPLTNEEKAELYSTVDHRLYSEVNAELIDLIIATFEKGLVS